MVGGGFKDFWPGRSPDKKIGLGHGRGKGVQDAGAVVRGQGFQNMHQKDAWCFLWKYGHEQQTGQERLLAAGIGIKASSGGQVQTKGLSLGLQAGFLFGRGVQKQEFVFQGGADKEIVSVEEAVLLTMLCAEIVHFRMSWFYLTATAGGAKSARMIKYSIECWLYHALTDRFLLLRCSKNHHHEEYWQPVTGGRESGEASIQACLREVKEETGVDLTAKQVELVIPEFSFCIPDARIELRKPIYLARVLDDRVRLSSEHIGYCWFDAGEVDSRLYWASNRESFRQVLACTRARENAASRFLDGQDSDLQKKC